MLILRRKSGESIVIGDNIIVTVLDINEGSVRLAIDAPKVIPILRSELLQAADANRDSATASRDSLRLLSGNATRRPRAVRPGTAARHAGAEPATDTQTPVSEAETPATDTQTPVSEAETPAPETQAPVSDT